jgi:hypothetical protein
VADASKRYRSFISYSQKDRVWGRRLQSWLETYRVPIGVVAAIGGGQRLGRFFRDEAEMPAASSIAEVVREAIETAESLIVVCSPRSAQSQWVAAEIDHFRSANPDAEIFAVIIDGRPNSGDPTTECFPLALRRGGGAGEMPIEPVGVDVRVDSKARICARLAAGLLQVDFDDLWQRDRRRSERRQRRAILALSVVSVVFALLAGTAIWAGLAAQRQAAAAEAARMALQREYLAILGESALDDVLTSDLDPGVLKTADGAGWMSLMRRDAHDFIVAREFGRGRIFAVAHDGLLDAARIPRGVNFLRRTIAWLNTHQDAGTVAIAGGHCEWMAVGVEDWLLPSLLRSWGYAIRPVPGPLTDAALADANVLVIGNAWEDFTPAELDAVERFARAGGGVLLAGLGWSWLSDGADPKLACATAPRPKASPTLDNYPMNMLGARFGVRWTKE